MPTLASPSHRADERPGGRDARSSTDSDPFPQIASTDFVANYRGTYANYRHKAQ